MQSFWMGGFEGADHVNRHGVPLDMVAISGHADDLDGDYARLVAMGLHGARESIGWRLAEPHGDGRFDFSRAVAMATAAQRHGVEIAWTLMHYGVPPGVSLLDDALIPRFAAFAEAAARALAPHIGPAPVVTPVNEISYLAWAACESNLIHPHLGDRRDPRRHDLPDGFEVKRRLVAASLAAMERFRSVIPRARFLHVDPLVHVVPPRGADTELVAEAGRFRDFQWQAADMLLGRLCPELGGHERALDALGVNHYPSSQWEFGSGEQLAWHGGDERRRPFHALLVEAWQRYRKPIVVAETGHVGALRAPWLAEIARETQRAGDAGVPVRALCLYPAIDRPCWDETSHWHRCGLWDAAHDHDVDGDLDGDASAELDTAADGRTPPVLASPASPVSPAGRRLDRALAETLRACQLERARWLPSHLDRRPSDMTHPASHRTPLVVLSHLRWDFVFQRPQHLLSRIGRKRPVIFVEEPVRSADGRTFLEVRPGAPGVEVLRPHTLHEAPGFADEQLPTIATLVEAALAERGIDDHAVWLYTPMALPVADALKPRALVFDCMDELAAFKFAPPALVHREGELMRRADVVFTGGPSLYEKRKDRNPNVHCLPSSVDAAHFLPPSPEASRSEVAQQVRALQQHIAGPRLGWFGVIDERTDLDLVARLADADASWQVVMVGPVVKIDPASLPQRPNLHWLGGQPYEALPHLVASWQVCLMPFALNESTRFISPTKTLEYLAAGKPVVSTAVHDVGVLYGEAVVIAHDADAFVAACRAALAETGEARSSRLLRGALVVARSSWDRTAERVEEELAKVLGEATAAAAASAASEPISVSTAAATSSATGAMQIATPTATAVGAAAPVAVVTAGAAQQRSAVPLAGH